MVEGAEYTVIDSFIDEGYCWYVLEEDNEHEDDEYQYGYDSVRFTTMASVNQAVNEVKEIIKIKIHHESTLQESYNRPL